MLKKIFVLVCMFSLLLANSFNVKADSKISIVGFQYNCELNGFRVLYSSSPDVKETGLLFGASFLGANDDELIFNNDSDNIKTIKASDKASISYETFVESGGDSSLSKTNNYYLYTVIKNGTTKKMLEANYIVRPYAVTDNDEIIYGKIQHFNIYKIAYSLYYNCLSFNKTSHEFLYDNIIKVCNSDAPKKDYDWSGIVNF